MEINDWFPLVAALLALVGVWSSIRRADDRERRNWLRDQELKLCLQILSESIQYRHCLDSSYNSLGDCIEKNGRNGTAEKLYEAISTTNQMSYQIYNSAIAFSFISSNADRRMFDAAMTLYIEVTDSRNRFTSKYMEAKSLWREFQDTGEHLHLSAVQIMLSDISKSIPVDKANSLNIQHKAVISFTQSAADILGVGYVPIRFSEPSQSVEDS